MSHSSITHEGITEKNGLYTISENGKLILVEGSINEEDDELEESIEFTENFLEHFGHLNIKNIL